MAATALFYGLGMPEMRAYQCAVGWNVRVLGAKYVHYHNRGYHESLVCVHEVLENTYYLHTEYTESVNNDLPYLHLICKRLG